MQKDYKVNSKSFPPADLQNINFFSNDPNIINKGSKTLHIIN